MKKQITMAMAAAVVFAAAGAANAATHEINMYGASAQYLFWAAAAPTKLVSVDGCTLSKYGKDSGGKYVSIVATNCTTPPSPMAAGDTIIFRYASKASYSGIWALKNKADTDDKNPNTTWTTPAAANLAVTCQTAPNASAANHRWFGDDATFTGGTVASPALITGGVCKPVNIAASDVEGSTFTQTSSGKSKGPMGGTAASINRSFTGTNAVDDSGLANAKPLVVPFGFFVNRAVAQYKCTDGATTNGQLCSKNADCTTGAFTTCAATSNGLIMDIATNCSNANTIDELTREQAVAIYSNSIKNWSDFGGYYIATPVVACARHAGSGTHSTLDWTVMKNTWGANLHALQILPLSGTDYTAGVYNINANLNPPAYPRTYASGGTISNNNVFWFNDGSSDMMSCVKGGNAASTWTGATAHSASCLGAVGYADADQAASLPANVVAVAYAGHLPTREKVRNGKYDFFSNQNMYWIASDLISNAFANNLDTFAGNAANLTPANVGAKADYWNARSEMVFNRASLKAWPTKALAGANNNQP